MITIMACTLLVIGAGILLYWLNTYKKSPTSFHSEAEVQKYLRWIQASSLGYDNIKHPTKEMKLLHKSLWTRRNYK